MELVDEMDRAVREQMIFEHGLTELKEIRNESKKLKSESQKEK